MKKLIALALLMIIITGYSAKTQRNIREAKNMKPYLIAYSSKAGSTKEIAQYMASTLQSAGYNAVAEELSKVKSLSAYGGIIIGAPVYVGNWHKEAKQFVKEHAASIKAIPHAIFMVGMRIHDASKKSEIDQILATERSLLSIIDEGRFAGKLDYKKLNWFSRSMCKIMGAKEEDKRDWEKIKLWSIQMAQGFEKKGK